MNRELFNVCNEVRAKQIGLYKTIDGSCKEVTLAIAFLAAKKNITVCICSGTYDGKDHYWIRHENTIYDATVSQFGVPEEVLVVHESEAKKFSEGPFVVVNGKVVGQLL